MNPMPKGIKTRVNQLQIATKIMLTTTIKRINANFSISSIGKIITPWNLPISGGYSKKEVREVAYRLLESGLGKLTFYQDCDPPLAWEVNGRAKTITVFVNGERTKVYFFEEK